jgi:hypothetical protein
VIAPALDCRQSSEPVPAFALLNSVGAQSNHAGRFENDSWCLSGRWIGWLIVDFECKILYS